MKVDCAELWRTPLDCDTPSPDPATYLSLNFQDRQQVLFWSCTNDTCWLKSATTCPKTHERCSRGNRREPLTHLRLVFSLIDYHAGPVTIVHANRVLFLERVTHYKNNVTCLSPMA
ncbi:uncharacterized protein LOC121831765 [Peromyscus maniculatus bairdii]|uniref:uncharacterized protein LOC121831765 n=1 Tax=Peromyscus maniculatus bairdii TaxID=230844 RepID=UPI003FD37F0F